LKRNLYFPTYSNGLKEIANFLGYNWSNKDSSGLQSIVWRWKWDNNKDEKIKDDLIQYNKEDCIALSKVFMFLQDAYNKVTSNQKINCDDKIILARNVETSNNYLKFKDMTYANDDVEIITKSAYFHYQRDKIFFRTNKNIKRKKKKTNRSLKDYTKYNKRIIINADKCPFCWGENLKADISDRYLKRCLDLKFFKFGIKRWITEYITFSYKCLDCRKKFIPKKFKKLYLYSRNKSIIPSTRSLRRNQIGYGHNFLAWSIYQSVLNKITFRNIEKNLLDFFDLYIDNRYLWGLKLLASEYYKPTYNNIVKNLIKGSLIHSDETKVKLKTHSGYIWVFTNMENVLYLYIKKL